MASQIRVISEICLFSSVNSKVFSMQSTSSLFSSSSISVFFLPIHPPAASPTSPDKKAKRHEVVSDPTPFGVRGSVLPHLILCKYPHSPGAGDTCMMMMMMISSSVDICWAFLHGSIGFVHIVSDSTTCQSFTFGSNGVAYG